MPRNTRSSKIMFVKNVNIPVRYNGNTMKASLFKVKNNPTISEVKQYSNRYARQMYSRGVRGKVMLSLHFNHYKWKSGYFVDISDDVDMPIWNPQELYDQDIPDDLQITGIQIYYQKK